MSYESIRPLWPNYRRFPYGLYMRSGSHKTTPSGPELLVFIYSKGKFKFFPILDYILKSSSINLMSNNIGINHSFHFPNHTFSKVDGQRVGHEKWQGLSFPMSFGLYFFFNTDMPYALYWCNITIMRETILQHSFIMVLFFNSTLPHMEKWNYKELIRFPAGFFVLLWLLFLFYVSTITSINYT